MSSDPSEQSFVFNGLDATSGSYLMPAMNVSQLSALAQGQSFSEPALGELSERVFTLNSPDAGVEADARELAETGWGVIFAFGADPALREALQPLLNLRKNQAGERYKEYWGSDGYRPNETKDEFLSRYGMGPGPVNPDKVPYYLLLIGDPDSIPFPFQYQLDVQYAVGRIHFDRIEEYASYAQSVVEAESGLNLNPKATFFGVANPDDPATNLSSTNLVEPLVEKLRIEQPQWAAALSKALAATGQTDSAPVWEFESVLREEATHQRLSDLLHGENAPALLFTASHGIGFPNGHERQLPHQGGLVCQDWPGPLVWRGALPEEFYFAGDHLDNQANLLGAIAFFFACYGAGTPNEDEFAHQIWSGQPDRKQIAPHNFIAGLPKRMLGLPKGGALAAIGHIERAWGSSFYWGTAGPQLQVFEDCFERLIKGGFPVGYAMEVFNNRYAEIAVDLSAELRQVQAFGKKPNDAKLANLWTSHNDARNYVIIGDPAVRLSVASGSNGKNTRPVIPEVAAPIASAEIPADPDPAAQPVPPPSAAVPPIAAGAFDEYGLMDNFKQAQVGLNDALQDFVSKLGQLLTQALDDATTLEVATYVSTNLDTVTYEGGRFNGAKLRALVRVKIDGDTLICLPEGEDGEINTDLWRIHMEMVQQAQTSRAELIRTAVSAAGELAKLIKP